MQRMKKLEAWLRRHVYTERDGARCSRFVLHHLGAAGKIGSEVFTLEAKDDDEAIEAMGEEIFEAGEGDASGLGSVQSYVVLAFYGEQKKPNGRFTFRAKPDVDDDDVDATGMTEPPTNAGIVAQTMRHNEAIFRTNTQGMGQAFNGLQTMIARQSEVIDHLLQDRFNTVELVEQLTTQKHERELELLQEARKEEKQQQLIEKFSPLVPILANKLVGQKVLPAADPQSLMLSEFFKTLTPEQLAGLQGVLTEGQLMTVLSLAQNFVGEKPTNNSGSS